MINLDVITLQVKGIFALIDMRIWLTLILFIPFILLSQKESYNWYFGIGAGITFNPSGNPSVLTNSVMSSGKGSAVISDSCTGQLFFYTNGDSIINRNHQTMQNGTNLDGSSGSTQSAIIVPLPNSNSGIFYVFTVERTNGLKYSVVDINLAGGLGAVVNNKKNIALVSPTLEKVTAVRHDNGSHVWIITHTVNSNEFVSYLLTNTGLVNSPVISVVGSTYGSTSQLGYMKASPKGDKLALALSGDKRFDLFDFDNKTGVVSNQKSSGDHYNFAYGIEFSPDGSKLYCTSNLGLYQYDLASALPGKPLGDSTFLGSAPEVAIQLGPDGKIYCNEGYFLGRINQPDEAGNNCNYSTKVISLGTMFASSGLPTFMQSFFNPMYIEGVGNCYGIPTEFELVHDNRIDSLRWDFGEPSSGSKNFSKLENPSHLYNDTGTYLVTTFVFREECGVTLIDTVSKKIKIVDLPIPVVDLGNDTAICEGDSLLLWTDGKEPSYVWSTGSKESEINVMEEGIYWVKATNTCGALTDSITITYFKSNVYLELGKDTGLCTGKSMSLVANQKDPTIQYEWSTGAKSPQIHIKEAGEYWVIVKDICYEYYDTVLVSEKLSPQVSLGNDTIICEGIPLVLDVSYPNSTYLWIDNSVGPTFTVTEEGAYRVRVSNECGSVSDDIYVRSKDCACRVFVPNSFTPNSDGLNDAIRITYSCDFIYFSFEIYDRWGEIVFKTNNPDVQWDGTKKGKDAPNGVYLYHIKYRSTDPAEEEEQEMKGTLTLYK